jgi:cyclopropane fatty-acyl-phospholipid synthase-like methyltransferase
MNKNIAYKTDKLARYFTYHRVSWSQFYESERNIIKKLELGPSDSILDIGCGWVGWVWRLMTSLVHKNIPGLKSIL